jgi:hypothetical protein
MADGIQALEVQAGGLRLAWCMTRFCRIRIGIGLLLAGFRAINSGATGSPPTSPTPPCAQGFPSHPTDPTRLCVNSHQFKFRSHIM